MKNKGYTLLELMLVMSIIVIFTGAMGLSLSNYSEKSDYKEVTQNLSTIFEIMANDANYSHKNINIKFDYNNNLILFEKEGNIISKFKLPKRYTYSNTGGTNIHFTETGNISPMFSFEVKEGISNFFKLTFISTDKFVQRVWINKYLYNDSHWEEVK